MPQSTQRDRSTGPDLATDPDHATEPAHATRAAPGPGTATPGPGRRRYALVGLSNRGVASFARPLLGPQAGPDGAASVDGPAGLGYGPEADDYSAYGELVAVLDTDRIRAQAFVESILPAGHPRIPVFGADGFAEMVRRARPDAVIITSPDHSHAGYILAALSAGVEVITEKPMTSTAADAARVLAAEQSTGATVRVTHNFRYTARHQQIKQLLLDGAVGRVLHIALDYHVDIRHGASYFLRWNRRRDRSGGLSLHKSSHHLDLLSWWLGDLPRTVYAVGGRDFYGPGGAHRPIGADGSPMTGDELRDHDPYFLAQQGSGAFPDGAHEVRRGLFGLPYPQQYPAGRELTLYDEEIDVEDNFAALLGFRGGAHAGYTIDFSSPWEGYRVLVTGTHGSLEAFTGRTPDGEPLPGGEHLTVRPLFAAAYDVAVDTAPGGHDGADPAMRRDLFVEVSEHSRRLGLAASATEGAYAVAAGEALWRSVASGEVVDVEALLAATA